MPAGAPILPPLHDPPAAVAMRFGALELSYANLRKVVAALVPRIAGATPVAVWAAPEPHTVVAVAAAAVAGVTAVPLNPRSGPRELAHIVADSAPEAILAPPGIALPDTLGGVRRVDVDLERRRGGELPAEPPDEAPALVLYTSGTTGPPKGAVLPRRALAFGLDALAEAWAWTAEDAVVQALPLYHAHGLVLGSLGPLRLGGTIVHTGRFEPATLAGALERAGGLLFAVPTMYARLESAAREDPSVARGLAAARLLVSGSAGLPDATWRAVEAVSGQRIAQRYGLTETLMNTAARADAPRRAGTVGPPLRGIEVRLVDDGGADVDGDGEIGEVLVRGPNLFAGYLGRPDATAAAMRDGFFVTGDLACRDGGELRILGRRATDLIKTGGYRVGAGEVEAALLEHPDVTEVAVTGEPDEDLGQRIVAWVVADGRRPAERELVDLVAAQLAPHKRPRAVRFLDALPRTALGKVRKSELR